LDKDQLAGKVAVVTGAASGIGRAIAERFAAEGAQVVALDLAASSDDDPEPLKQISRLRCDVSYEASVEDAIGVVRTQHGRLDVLCNAAGITAGSGAMTDLSVETFDRVMAVNVRGTFLIMKHAIPLMVASGGGSIINLGSIASFVASGRSSAYTASKGAVMALTRSTAVEFATRGIRANAICPGTIESPINAAMDPELKAVYLEKHPAGRFGRVDEIAAMALFLASDECTFATGAAFVVDGGRTAT
jgi:NAD(P)-dependent dehydrogenase (short-subunit alcohol dehydrogenase family)